MTLSLRSTMSRDRVGRGMISIGQFRQYQNFMAKICYFFIEPALKDAIWSGLRFLEAQINQELMLG